MCVTTLGVLQFPLLHRGQVQKEDHFLANQNWVSKCASQLEQRESKMFGDNNV